MTYSYTVSSPLQKKTNISVYDSCQTSPTAILSDLAQDPVYMTRYESPFVNVKINE